MNSAHLHARIRAAIFNDAPELARLYTVLGHATFSDQIERHWSQWGAEGNAAFVAERTNGMLAGLITVHRMIVLHRPKPLGRITALVVDADQRGSGLGRALVGAAEQMLIKSGCGLIEVTSNMVRVDAHAFYERLGYERTSFRFAKTVG